MIYNYFVKNRLAKSTLSCYSNFSLSNGGHDMGIHAAQFYFCYYYFFKEKK